MTVWDNVAFGPAAKKLGKAEVARRVDELLEVVRLTEFVNRKPAQLSGGQQQRVALARALVNYPSALLLDEPLGALDLKLRQVMQFELKRIQREVGITFVYVTHDQEEALTMSDRIAVMDAGRVQQIGTPVEIYERPANVFVAGFIGQANLWPCRVTGGARGGDPELDGLGTTLRSARRHPHRGGPRRRRHGPPRAGPGRRRAPGATDAANAVEATVTDLTFQGRWSACRWPLPTGRRSSPRWATTSSCPSCARATRCGPAGRRPPRWCCPPPTSPPPKTWKRCSTRAATASAGRTTAAIHEDHRPWLGTNPYPRTRPRFARLRRASAAGAVPDLSRRRFLGRGGRGRRRRRARPVVHRRLRRDDDDDGLRGRRGRGRHAPHLELALLHHRDAGAGVRGGLGPTCRTRRTSTTTRSGSPRSRTRWTRARTSAPTW